MKDSTALLIATAAFYELHWAKTASLMFIVLIITVIGEILDTVAVYRRNRK